MLIPEKMKHNRFKAVRIPTPAELFGRVGFRPVNPSGYTGDETIKQLSKLEQVQEASARQLEELREAEENRRKKAEEAK